MTVSREELERFIDELEREIPDPREGIHGPRSQVWYVDREAVLFLGGGRAALLQLAHPFVAHAVDQHSATTVDPLGRFQRTFENVFAMVFGPLDKAIDSARRVHFVHTKIHGTIDEDVGRFRCGDRYEANDEHALMWVHATLVDTAVQVYELVVRPLTKPEKDRYYEETKRFARLFGISEAVVPPDWDAFRAYFDRTLHDGTIAVGRPARSIGRFLFTARRPSYEPLVRWTELITAGLLPDHVRDGFEIPFGLRRRALYRASIAALRAAHPLLPKALRHQPAYVVAKRRLRGETEPSRVTEAVELLTQGLLNQAPYHELFRRSGARPSAKQRRIVRERESA